MKRILAALLCGLFFLPLAAKNDVKFNSRHYLTAEGGVGYSALMYPSSDMPWKGLAGANLQVGYEWKYKRFLLHSGLELSSVNSLSLKGDFQEQVDFLYQDANNPSGVTMQRYFDFVNFRENQYLGQLSIPVMAGGRFGDFYFLAGAKFGWGLWSPVKSVSTLTTTTVDPTLVGTMHDMPRLDMYTADETWSNSFHTSGAMPNIMASAEIGWYLDEWMPKNARALNNKRKSPVSYRLSLFCDYGITSCVGAAKAGENGFPSLVTVDYPRNVDVANLWSTASTKVNSLLVGAKFAVLFQVSKEPVKKPVATWLLLNTTDEATGKPISSSVTIRNMKTKKAVVNNKSLQKGYLKRKLQKGEWDITVSKKDYYSYQQNLIVETLGDTVNMDVALRHRPWFRLHVVNAETSEPVAAVATLSDKTSGKTLYTLTTDSLSGNVRAVLEDGEYAVSVRQLGYETWSADAVSNADSLVVAIKPIKKGEVILIRDLFFASNQTRILPESEGALTDLYRFLAENPTVRIRIVGHTDSVGSDADNQRLSEGRANAVKADVVERGIDAARIETEGKGESAPIADNATEEGRAKNRRVEFVVL
ncbi:MAG: OmpA family protein [Paludibacter sp.]|nr:OmpA family protein [Bacteroidales bacterium]MCM1069252.1 OmpA family protein [Prevotella sp.]MCM1353765.1 OmpA family protein [Bacteroides sp.]MCM1442167.1 OmpA family protein [Muribaculum sp.]MCM1482536.1 OmpA family protein [Paludibacter sp.]